MNNKSDNMYDNMSDITFPPIGNICGKRKNDEEEEKKENPNKRRKNNNKLCTEDIKISDESNNKFDSKTFDSNIQNIFSLSNQYNKKN